MTVTALSEERLQEMREHLYHTKFWVEAWNMQDGEHIEDLATRRLVAHDMAAIDVRAILGLHNDLDELLQAWTALTAS